MCKLIEISKPNLQMKNNIKKLDFFEAYSELNSNSIVLDIEQTLEM